MNLTVSRKNTMIWRKSWISITNFWRFLDQILLSISKLCVNEISRISFILISVANLHLKLSSLCTCLWSLDMFILHYSPCQSVKLVSLSKLHVAILCYCTQGINFVCDLILFFYCMHFIPSMRLDVYVYSKSSQTNHC